MKSKFSIDLTPFVFWTFCSLVAHVVGGNWLVGLTIGIGISLLVGLFLG